jgi:hypothetical protein
MSKARSKVVCAAAISAAWLGVVEQVIGAESGFSIYPLGSMSFSAGTTPPPGFYATSVLGYYRANFARDNLFGGVAALGLDLKFVQSALNLLYVPQHEFLGARLGVSVTAPVGCIDLQANLVVLQSRSAATSGCGLGDMSGRVQLGWTRGDFSHTLYLTGFAPTGRYDKGFNPNIGLNRPAIDVTWAASWLERQSSIELSGSAGFTFNFENTATQYLSGNEFHLEWAVGKKFGTVQLGFGGYHYWQITPDSGPGATLGGFKGRTNGIGPAASWGTQIADHAVVFSGRFFVEYDVMNRFQGTSSTLSATVRF